MDEWSPTALTGSALSAINDGLVEFYGHFRDSFATEILQRRTSHWLRKTSDMYLGKIHRQKKGRRNFLRPF